MLSSCLAKPQISSLLDLEEDIPTVIKCAEKEPPEDRQYIQEVNQLAVSVPRKRRQLVSRCYVSLPDLPMSHAALKPFFGSETLRDNSGAVQFSVFLQWKNTIVYISCSAKHVKLPSVLRLMVSKCLWHIRSGTEAVHPQPHNIPEYLSDLCIVFCNEGTVCASP